MKSRLLLALFTSLLEVGSLHQSDGSAKTIYMSDLSGKSVLITGASRGIGAAAARLCHANGADIIVHASGEGDAMTALANDLKLKPSQIIHEDLSLIHI